MKDLIEKVIKWADEKGIYEKSTALAQLNGAIGELYEFREAVIKGKPEKEINTEAGDIIVFLINTMYLEGADSQEIEDLLISAQNYYAARLDFEHDILSAAFRFSNLEIYDGLGELSDLFDFKHCLKLAYDKISKRTGEMKNGKFIKEGDL